MMLQLNQYLHVLWFGGPLIYPLLVLAVIMVAIMLDKAYVYWRYARAAPVVAVLANSADAGWSELERQLALVNPHHHFVCRKCGAAFDFSCRDLDVLKTPDEVKKLGTVGSVHVEFRGLCARCLEDEET